MGRRPSVRQEVDRVGREEERSHRGLRPAARLSVPDVDGVLRPRLITALDRIHQARLGMVVAPAGAGKTTLLAQWAKRAAADVAWYRADPSDNTVGAVVAQLGTALAIVSPGHPAARDLQTLVDAIARHESPLVLVVDDLHLVEHTHVGHLLQRLLMTGPPHLRVLVGSRRTPTLNLARTEVPTVVVGEDELRFRASETAALFRDVYRRPLPAETTALLTRQTEGWAAGLHLMHLSLPPSTTHDRRTPLNGAEARYARRYLDSQVLGGLSDHLVDFLRRTACFERLTAERCDDLLDASTSRRTLAEVAQRSGMVRSDDGGLSYRVHGVLRRHLETELLDDLPGPAASSHYRRAATLLRLEHDYAAAVRVLVRIGDWEATSELLGRHGEEIVSAPTAWVEGIPEWAVAGEPWLLLARARARLDHGDLEQASREAARAAASTGHEDLRRQAERTRDTADRWRGGPLGPAEDTWSARVHAAVVGAPGGRLRRLSSTASLEDEVGRGIAAALRGDLRTARRVLRRCSIGLDDARLLTVARLALAVVSDDGHAAVEALLTDERLLDHPWLSRLAQALATGHHAVDQPVSLDPRMLVDEIEECDVAGDAWGALSLVAVRALSLLRAGRPDESALEDLVARCRTLEAVTLEAWARSFLALAATATAMPEAVREAQSAEAFARAASVPGALSVAYAALAAVAPDGGDELLALAVSTAEDAGFDLAPWRWTSTPPVPPSAEPWVDSRETGRGPIPAQPGRTGPAPRATVAVTGEPPAITIRCFGRFQLRVHGQEPNLTRVRPRARAVLRLLALEAGRPVHRELLVDALWRDLDPVAGTHNLHVSVSSLRAVLEPGVPRGASRILVRDGERYQLAMPPGSSSDLLEFDRAIAEAETARIAGDSAAAVRALDRALSQSTGDVLPEDGPAEWVIGVREHYRVRVAEAAATLAELHLSRHDPPSAATAALRSLDVDPCRDASWRLLLSAYAASGDLAAAEQARRSYAEVLTSLGVASSSAAAVHPRPHDG